MSENITKSFNWLLFDLPGRTPPISYAGLRQGWSPTTIPSVSSHSFLIMQMCLNF